MRPTHGGNISARELIDFSTSLNPFAPSIPEEIWLKWLKEIEFYPSTTSERANKRLAEYLKIPSSDVVATNGGLEALKFALTLQPNKEVILPKPCFSEYAFLCEQLSISHSHRSLDEHDWSKPEKWIPTVDISRKTILLANPNNPTGTSIPHEMLYAVIKESIATQTHWIIDEAFIDFCTEPDKISLLEKIQQLPNLIICGSMTKQWRIPGLRLGYLCASDKNLLEQIKQERITWPLHSVTEGWIENYLTLESKKLLKQSLSKLHMEKVRFSNELTGIEQIKSLPSDANFILCKLRDSSVQDLDKFLVNKGIKIRTPKGIPELGQSFFRIGIRSRKENQTLADALKEYFEVK